MPANVCSQQSPTALTWRPCQQSNEELGHDAVGKFYLEQLPSSSTPALQATQL